MAFGSGKVHDPALSEQVEPAAVVLANLLDLRADLATVAAQGRLVDFNIEMACVAENRAVPHALEVVGAQGVAVAGRRDEQVALLGSRERRHHLVAVHRGLERRQRVDLADDDSSAGPGCAIRHAASAASVADHDHAPAGEEDVRRAKHPVERGLPGSVAVVEQVLRAALVDRDQREREVQPTRADHACRGFLGGSDQVTARERRYEVGAVVHRQLRLRLDYGRQPRSGVLAVAGVDSRTFSGERVDDVVLGRQGIRRAQRHAGAAGDQGADQVGRFRRHVQRTADPDSPERLFARKTFADRAEDGHLPVRPLNPTTSSGNGPA